MTQGRKALPVPARKRCRECGIEQPNTHAHFQSLITRTGKLYLYPTCRACKASEVTKERCRLQEKRSFVGRAAAAAAASDGTITLIPRDMAILRYVLRTGASDGAIAAHFHLSLFTVRTAIDRIHDQFRPFLNEDTVSSRGRWLLPAAYLLAQQEKDRP